MPLSVRPRKEVSGGSGTDEEDGDTVTVVDSVTSAVTVSELDDVVLAVVLAIVIVVVDSCAGESEGYWPSTRKK